MRYWLWLAASVKFLVPFAALTALGRQFGWRAVRTVAQPQMTFVVDAVAQPFSQPELSGSASTAAAASGVAARAADRAGCDLAGRLRRDSPDLVVRWRRVRARCVQATPVVDGRALDMLRRLEQRDGITTPIALVSSDSPLEPGVFGILRPGAVVAARIAEHLGDEQVEAIIAHELSHVRRRDNLVAALTWWCRRCSGFTRSCGGWARA